MEAEQKALESTIRAIVQSSKGTVTVKELERDYYTLENKAVPYKKFGCDTLDRFLKTFDSLFVSGNGAFATVRAKVDSSSKHVTSLIDRQKSTNKKAGFIPAPRRGRGNFHYQGPPRNYSEHKTPSYKTYPTSDHRNYPSNETWKPSNAENRRYPTTDSRKYATNEPRKYTSPAEPPKYATTEPSYHRSHSTADSHKYNSMTESSYHRSNSSESSYHRPNVAEETWDNYSGQSHTTSNSRRGGYGASSRGGYSGAVNIAPRFQTKRQIEAVDNARDQLVVNIKDNERQVIWEPRARGILITIKTDN